MKEYVIDLISNDCNRGNSYGYWTGKEYTYQSEKFPIHTGNRITNETRIFKSKVRAETSAQKCYLKYAYVDKAIVEEYRIEKQND